MIVLFQTPFSDPVGDAAFNAAVAATGIVPDKSGDAFADFGWAINPWRIAAVPCLALIHDGTAVDQIADVEWFKGKKAAAIKGRFTNAVKAYEAANVPEHAPIVDLAASLKELHAKVAELQALVDASA